MKYLPLNEPCLKWQTNFKAYRFLIENHIARSATYLRDLLNHPGFISPDLLRHWSKLGLAEQVGLLIDPNAAEIIFAANEDLALACSSRLHLQLEDLMAAILRKAGSGYTHARTLPWLDHEPIHTANGIRVDVRGPLHGLGNPGIQSPDDGQIKYYLSRINDALEAIGEISPEALSLIETFTNTIHIRQNPGHPGFSSWSTHIGIGKITASNLHYVADDLAEVMDFLIHESIHGFLHLVEEHYGPFLEKEAYGSAWLKDKIVPSPWSGKRIDLGSYTHAIGVWYGLAQFWLKARRYEGRHARELSFDRIGGMIHQASAGFMKNDNVHLAAAERFVYMNKDYLSFSLKFQPEIADLRREAAHA